MKVLAIASFGCLSVVSTPAFASILGSEELSIDLTNPAEANAKATWSDPDKVATTKRGLGWDGQPAESRDFWLQTTTLAIGLSWRPAQSAKITVEIDPPVESIRLANGETSLPYPGTLFVRHSPDAQHWSSWQAASLEVSKAKDRSIRRFTAVVQVPRRDRQEYERYMREYRKLDVPWGSDEAAIAKWILKQDPKFFEKPPPFIGYIQFLYEGQLHGGQRLSRFHARASFGLSGMHLPPKDPRVYEGRDRRPWRFKTPKRKKT